MPRLETPRPKRTRTELLEGSYARYLAVRRRRLVVGTVSGVTACALLVGGVGQLLRADGPTRRIVTAGVRDKPSPSPSKDRPETPAASPTRPASSDPAWNPQHSGGSPAGIREFPLSAMIGYGNALTAGPDGALWFVKGFGNNALVRMSVDGAVSEFPTYAASPPPAPGTVPPGAVDVAAGRDGALWFVEDKHIGRMTTDGTFTKFPIPGSPSPLASFGGGVGAPPGYTGASSIVAAPDGALWFNELWGDRIGRITTGGEIAEFDLPNRGTVFEGPVHLTVGPDGALWFTALSRRVWRLDPGSKVFTPFDIPPDLGIAHTDDIAAGGDVLWIASGDTLLRLTTDGTWTRTRLPAAQSPGPFAPTVRLTSGPGGTVWFTHKERNAIGYVSDDGRVTEIPLPTPNRTPVGITTGPDGALWFSMQGGIGRVDAP